MKYAYFLLLCVPTTWTLPFHGKWSKRLTVNNAGSRIINGDTASRGQFPWQVSLNIVGDFEEWFCGGAIISQKFILTAGHCLNGAVMGFVTTGVVDINSDGTNYMMGNTFLPEGFDYATLTDDIGLLEVLNPIEFDEYTSAIDLLNGTVEAGTEMTVSGWGYTNNDGQKTSILNYVNVVTISNNECMKTYGHLVQDSMICSTGPNYTRSGFCFGDTGSPAVINIDGKTYAAAVASFVSDNGCEVGDPNGFTRIAPYREWIKNNADV